MKRILDQLEVIEASVPEIKGAWTEAGSLSSGIQGVGIRQACCWERS
jgi:hypothetical protein